mmetsp:Transcript_78934/g.223387  ORF Transcript_78934/g.223387 Transcript_78934/m.223387 type:complete len:187 (-) Transcript_78934:72-632(-)
MELSRCALLFLLSALASPSEGLQLNTTDRAPTCSGTFSLDNDEFFLIPADLPLGFSFMCNSKMAVIYNEYGLWSHGQIYQKCVDGGALEKIKNKVQELCVKKGRAEYCKFMYYSTGGMALYQVYGWHFVKTQLALNSLGGGCGICIDYGPPTNGVQVSVNVGACPETAYAMDTQWDEFVTSGQSAD